MELVLNGLTTTTYTNFMQMNATSLSVEGLSTEIEGRSEALQKFMDTYKHFSDTLSAYREVLNRDMENVTKAINALMETDTKQSEQLESFTEYSKNYFLKP